MADPGYVTVIKSEPGVEINDIQEGTMGCISCGIPLGFVAIQSIAPPAGSFLFRTRFACAKCGPKIATLALMTEEGEA